MRILLWLLRHDPLTRRALFSIGVVAPYIVWCFLEFHRVDKLIPTLTSGELMHENLWLVLRVVPIGVFVLYDWRFPPKPCRQKLPPD